jgi:dUTP pyrophosphatase
MANWYEFIISLIFKIFRNIMANLEEDKLLLKVKRVSRGSGTLPTKAHDNDAGWDLYSDENVVQIGPHETKKISTGIAIKIPEGYFGLIRDRSSYGAKGISIHGGVIDCGYTGEIQIIVHNDNKKIEAYKDPRNGIWVDNCLIINRGDKIAQLVILPVPSMELLEVDNLEDTQRGDKGFGSSDTFPQ